MDPRYKEILDKALQDMGIKYDDLSDPRKDTQTPNEKLDEAEKKAKEKAENETRDQSDAAKEKEKPAPSVDTGNPHVKLVPDADPQA